MTNPLFKILFIVSIAVFLSANTQQVFGQTPPVLHCAYVLSNGTVELQWQMPNNPPCAGGTFDGYRVYVSTDGTNFTLLQAISNPTASSYIDSATPTTSNLYYRMTTVCNGIESPFSNVLDTADPVPPFLQVALVTGLSVQLQLSPSPSPETVGYIIYRADENGNFSPIDTVYEAQLITGTNGNITYTDQTALPGEHAEAYKVAAIDSCGNGGPDNGIVHQTVFLSLESNPCQNAIKMTWTAYEGFDVKQYDIYDNTTLPETLIQSVGENINEFTYVLPAGQSTACLQVRAINDSGIDNGNSNVLCQTIDQLDTPSYIQILNATVTDNNQVDVLWTIDDNQPINTIQILRGVKDSINLDELQSYPLPSPLPTVWTFVDNNDDELRTDRYPYVYQIQHTDDCDVRFLSGIVKTIFLEGRDYFDLNNRLEWNAFYLTDATVTGYNLFRDDNATGTYSLVTTLHPDSLTYNDPIDPENETIQERCYYIEATYTITLPNGNLIDTLRSRSNIVCITPSPRVFLPNAFLPNGVNNIFKPVLLYPDRDTYSLSVINRWGEIVFTTNNPDDGWDGKVRGALAQQGTYCYVLKMTAPNGTKIEKKGTVTLIR